MQKFSGIAVSLAEFCGGGVVAEMFRHKPATFSGGGGSSKDVSASPISQPHSVGGVVAGIFRDHHKPTKFGGGGGSVSKPHCT